MNNKHRYLWSFLLVSVFAWNGLMGQVNVIKPSGGEKAPPQVEVKQTDVILHAQPLPIPSLRYRLMPTLIELKPGNAALDYNNLVSSLPKDDEWDKKREKIDELLNMDRDTFKTHLDEVREVMVYQDVLLKHATSRYYCDWQETLEDGFSMLLPNLSEYRIIAKMLALQTRYYAVQSDYDQAINTLKYGFVMAKNLGQGKTLIQHLVGIAIGQLMSGQIEEMIQQPDCPNLYWTLAALPNPLVDIRQAVSNELSIYEYFCPGIKDIDKKIMSAQEANQAIQEMFVMISEGQSSKIATMIVLAGYTRAKKGLLEQGFDPEWVERIPAAQAVLLWQWNEYVPIRDETAQWFLVDYPRASIELEKIEKKMAILRESNAEIMTNLFFNLMPALSKCYLQMTRQQCTIAGLRTLEAIRLYAAQEGKLPERLEDISMAPILDNPVTGRPFDYVRTETGARLELYDPDPKRMEIFRIVLK